jgi:hypothetical protein
MTIKRGADGSMLPPASRTRDSAIGGDATRVDTQAGDATRAKQAPEPRSTSVDGFDSDPPTDTRLTGSGSNAVDDLLREARGRPSLLSSMSRVLDDTRKKLDGELASLRDEAARISADSTLSLDDKMTALADVRARMDKPRRRLVSIRRRTRTSTALAARDHDAAAKRARAAFLRAQSTTSTTEQAFTLATVASELKLPIDASAAGAALRIDVTGVEQRAAFGRRLADQAPSVDDAMALLTLLRGPPPTSQGSSQSSRTMPIDDDLSKSTDGTSQLLARLRDVRSN